MVPDFAGQQKPPEVMWVLERVAGSDRVEFFARLSEKPPDYRQRLHLERCVALREREIF
jgi:hypothetical protein